MACRSSLVVPERVKIDRKARAARCGAARFLARGAQKLAAGEHARGRQMGLARMLLGLIIVCGLLSIVYGVYTINSLMSADAGSQRMQEISGARCGRGRKPISGANT